MEITDIRVYPKEGQDGKLKAYVTLTFDNAFVVRNIKIIDGKGHWFVAMPSRKLRFPCERCAFRNETESRFCNKCGTPLPMTRDEDVEPGLEARQNHRDIAHPVTREFREYLQARILEAYQKQLSPSDRPALCD